MTTLLLAIKPVGSKDYNVKKARSRNESSTFTNKQHLLEENKVN